MFFSRPKYLLCKYMMSRVRSAKRVSSAAKTAAEAFSKLCHVVREGERKQLLFPLSKMAEGRGKAARSREEDPRPPSRSGEGWATRPASLPSFFSSSIMLFVPLAGSRCGRMTYSCVVSAPEALLGHRAGGRQPAGCGSHTATAPRRAAWSILMCHPASVLSLLMPPEGSKCRSESEPVISLSIWSRSVSTAEIGCLHFDGGG